MDKFFCLLIDEGKYVMLEMKIKWSLLGIIFCLYRENAVS